VKYENEPFDWKTGRERTQPLRSDQPPQTGFTGMAAQTFTSPAPSQTVSPPMAPPGATMNRDFMSQSHSQIFNSPTRQCYDMTIQDYRSPPPQSNQNFNPRADRSFTQLYTSPLPQTLRWPHITSAPHSPELNGQGFGLQHHHLIRSLTNEQTRPISPQTSLLGATKRHPFHQQRGLNYITLCSKAIFRGFQQWETRCLRTISKFHLCTTL
jgi:hypothetical protein